MSENKNTPIIQQLILNFIGHHGQQNLLPLIKHINESGGNIINSNIKELGNNCSGTLLIDGRWDTIIKIEKAIPQFASDLDLKIISARTTEPDDSLSDCEATYLPYQITINSQDDAGLLEKILAFFQLQEIHLVELSTKTYTSEYNSDLARVNILIKIPSDIHIPSLREQFDVLCFNENIDAELTPQIK